MLTAVMLAALIGTQPLQINAPTTAQIVVGESEVQIKEREEAQRQAEVVEKARVVAQKASSTQSGNTYSFGYCTYFVKRERPETPNGLGNAREWPTNSNQPVSGGVMVSYESSAGHVALITKVDGDYITVSEMNYAGWNVVSSRTIKWTGNGKIKGFMI